MKRIFVSIVAMLFISVLFMACADEKGPAELAMKAAEQAVAATKAEAEKLVPDQVAALESALASAKDKLAKGEFKEALSEAQGLVGKAKDVLAAAQAKKDELTQKWTELSQGLPQMVEAIQGKVDDLSKLKKLPKAITAEKLAEAKSGLEAVKADLAKAQESFKSGNIAEAIAVATVVKEKAATAMESLGITAPEPAKS
jgi:DNA repair exonuclease SbcCD ATPase subunit